MLSPTLVSRICALLALLLLACTQAPTPVVDKAAIPHTSSSHTERVHSDSAHHKDWIAPEFAESTPPALPPDSGCMAGNALFPFRRLQQCVDSLVAAGKVAEAIPLLRQVVNAQNSLVDLGHNTLRLARLLQVSGQKEEAAAVLEAFLVYKPQMLAWMDSLDAQEVRLQKQETQKALEFQPLVKQISNLMAVKSDFRLVRTMTDSLRTFPISDSLLRWSHLQDSLATMRGLTVLRAEVEHLRQLVVDAGNYDSAHFLLEQIAQWPADVRVLAGADSLADWVTRQEASDKAALDPQFWKTHDPAKVLADARQKKGAGQLDAAYELLTKLLQTKLRKEARKDLMALGEQYCTQSRQSAADLYTKFRKDHSAKNLQQAILALDLCLEKFPDNSARSKIMQNRDLLQQEQSKSKAGTP